MDPCYDTGIIGGGLAGLSLASLLSDAGLKVALFEQKKFPFHKVCGEYLSYESLGFLKKIGFNNIQDFPGIKKVKISSPKGYYIEHPLDGTGIGISRYYFDHALAKIAQSKGVDVFDNCRVRNIENKEEYEKILLNNNNSTKAKLVVGAYGKNSNMDPLLRPSVRKKKAKNFIAVKYHVQGVLEDNIIELHNFNKGYCGISKVEGNKYCLCYLTTADNLKSNDNNIAKMEKNVLMKNPFLNYYFQNFTNLYKAPMIISGLQFVPKSKSENRILLNGDAAGMIAPLCGNGMSMALQSADLLAPLIKQYFFNGMNKKELIRNHQKVWDQNFKKRIYTGIYFQQLSGNPFLTETVLRSLRLIPGLTGKLISLSHGKPF